MRLLAFFRRRVPLYVALPDVVVCGAVGFATSTMRPSGSTISTATHSETPNSVDAVRPAPSPTDQVTSAAMPALALLPLPPAAAKGAPRLDTPARAAVGDAASKPHAAKATRVVRAATRARRG